jgi:plastocyanin
VLLGAFLVHAQGAAADVTVVQKNRAFSARQVKVKVGEGITFVNSDDVRHNILSETRGAELDIIQPPGSSNTVRFAQPGTVVVECTIHPDMRLEVLVSQ